MSVDLKTGEVAADDAAAGDVRRCAVSALQRSILQPVTAAAVKAMLGDGEELALIDVREELIYSQNHLLWARNVPLSRLELRFARLVPRRTRASC